MTFMFAAKVQRILGQKLTQGENFSVTNHFVEWRGENKNTTYCQVAFSFSANNFQIYGGVLDFVVILQAVGRGNGMKNELIIKT